MAYTNESGNFGPSADRSSGTLIVVAFLSRPQMGNRRFASMIKTPEQMRKENEIAFANLRQLLERMRPRDTGKAV
jgi:hypothetical protein